MHQWWHHKTLSVNPYRIALEDALFGNRSTAFDHPAVKGSDVPWLDNMCHNGHIINLYGAIMTCEKERCRYLGNTPCVLLIEDESTENSIYRDMGEHTWFSDVM